jgi:4-amino-4-deoxy-L-arabinose transferase-like glycosyltransferase
MADLRTWLRTASTSRDLALLIAAIAVVFAALAGHIPFGSSIRYAEAAREMVALDDWVVPHLSYAPYFEKPILTYWLAAGARWLLGPGMYATHLPSGLAALVSVLCTWALAKDLRGGGFPFGAALFLLGSAMFLVMATELTTDPILSGCLALAWLAWWRHDRRTHESDPSPLVSSLASLAPRPSSPLSSPSPLAPRPSPSPPQPAACGGSVALRRPAGHASGLLRLSPGRPRPSPLWIWLFWAALGLGFLTKGPIAVALAGAAIAGFAFLTGGLVGVGRTLWAMHPLRGLAIIAAINLPWSILVWQRDPRFLEFFYVRYNFQAFLGSQVNHSGSPLLYFGVLAGAFMPWTLQTLAALGLQFRATLWPALRSRWCDWLGREPAAAVADDDRLRLYLICALVFPFLLLTASSSKLGTYLMPMYPPVAILALDAIWARAERPPTWLRASAAIFAVGLIGVAALAWPVWSAIEPEEVKRLDWSWWPVLAPAGVALLAAQVWAGWSAWHGRVLRASAVAGLGLAIATALVLPIMHLAIYDLVSARLAVLVRERGGPDDLVVVGRTVIHDYNLVYGLGRRVAILGGARETGMGHFAQAVPPPTPFPDDTYEVSGDNCDHPWLLSHPRFLEALRSNRRVWFFGEDRQVEQLLQAGARLVKVDRAANVVLLTNLPLADHIGATTNQGPGP